MGSRRLGAGLCDSPSGMCPSACHSHITRPVLTSISWITESVSTPSASPWYARQVHLDRVERVDPGGAFGRQPEFVQVGVVAVAGADRRDAAGRRCCRSRLRPGRSRPRGCVPATRSARACPRTAGPGSWSPPRPPAAGGTTRGCRSVRRSSGPACRRPGRARGTGRRARAPGLAGVVMSTVEGVSAGAEL